MKTAILSVIYHEPEWIQTLQNLSLSSYPVYLTDRNGVGGLSEAFNRGYNHHDLDRFRYVWFLTNITFSPGTLEMLESHMDRNPHIAAITPSFDSDHQHTRQIVGGGITYAPFVEFTCPLVRTSVYNKIALRDDMPYSGHDLDWGYRVRQAGYKLAVDHNCKVGHVYIRNNLRKHPATLKRAQLRKALELPTKQKLAEIYGKDWFTKLRCNENVIAAKK